MTSGTAAHLPRKFTVASSPRSRLSFCNLVIRSMSPVSSAEITIEASASRSRACCSAPSTGLNPGTSPASSGKLPRSDWQKLCIVIICNPPLGASSTFANNSLARWRYSGPDLAPIASRSRNNNLSSNWTQEPSNWLILSAISAAPAFVNVMHKRFSGSTFSSSNRRTTRAVKTWVFPVPADALSQMLSPGSTAASCEGISGYNGLRSAALLMEFGPLIWTDVHPIPEDASIGHNRHNWNIQDAISP